MLLLSSPSAFRCHSTAEAQNVNAADVERHSQQAESWWNPTGPMKGLHALNKVRVPLVRDGLVSTGAVPVERINKPNILAGLQILDVGCGAGILTKALAQLKAEMTAIDASPILLEKAEQLIEKDLGIDFKCDTIENHAKTNALRYDAVVASEVLEHVTDKTSFLRACVDTLKPGGSIFITTLNKTQLSWIAGIVAAEYVLNLVPQGTHDWNLFIEPAEVERILKDVDCSVVLLHGIKYEFWNNTCSWTSNTDVNYAIHAVKN